jgi:hypothetical protein
MEMKIVEDVQADDIGPELIVHWYDPEVKVKGVMVVDSLALGMATGGSFLAGEDHDHQEGHHGRASRRRQGGNMG